MPCAHRSFIASLRLPTWSYHSLLASCCLLLRRQVIAEAVLADPFEWSEAVLGKEPAEYCRWIKVRGGAVPLGAPLPRRCC